MAGTAQDWSSPVRHVHKKPYMADVRVDNNEVGRNANLKITITQSSEAKFWTYVNSGVCRDTSQRDSAFPYGEVLIIDEVQSKSWVVKTAAERCFFMEELRTALSKVSVRATSKMASIQLACSKYQEMEKSSTGMLVKKNHGACFYGNFTVHPAYLT